MGDSSACWPNWEPSMSDQSKTHFIQSHQCVPYGNVARLSPCFAGIRFQKDPTWSETGDRYLLKLFRDHLFHQVTEAGTPWIDLSHIVSCLNKVSQFFFLLPL